MLDLFDVKVHVLNGDISKPKFGLQDSQWEKLADTIDEIIHSASVVNMSLPYHHLSPANVYGTKEALNLVSEIRVSF